MLEIVLEQAVLLRQKGGAFMVRARSAQFVQEWLAEVEKLCTAFGLPPEGEICPPSLFVQPLGKQHVAVIQVSSSATAEADGLAFHLVVLREDDYVGLGGDPFTVAERCPAPWDLGGELPAVTWPRVAFPSRTVQQVRSVLKRPDGPNLLGGSQALLDGGRIVFERPEPDLKLLRDLWMLLPTRSRGEMWPATYAFSNSLRFHAVVVPPGMKAASSHEFSHYLVEDEAGDYPEGRYELKLQSAAEDGDQDELDQLFARRTRSEMWKFVLLILAVMVLLPFLMRWLAPPPAADDGPSASSAASSSSGAGNEKTK